VPLDDVLEFRAAHGREHRAYMRSLRRFVAELAHLDEPARDQALMDRREELADAADALRRLARTYWRKPLAGFGLGLPAPHGQPIRVTSRPPSFSWARGC
jgi:hypothetical protein